jgi:hypothetical protein
MSAPSLFPPSDSGGCGIDRRKIERRLCIASLYRDKVYVVRDFLSSEECAAWLRHCQTLKFAEETHAATAQTAYRDNGRLEMWDSTLAVRIWERLRPLVPKTVDGMTAFGCVDHIRLYRYSSAGRQRFGKHVDESKPGNQPGTRTAITVLVYLSGEAEGLVGGETVFYRGARSAEVTRFAPEAGALLYHGQ